MNDEPKLEKGETPPPNFVGYDHEGHFIHHCHCGAFGPYGFGYFPREGKMGTWYCKEHKP